MKILIVDDDPGTRLTVATTVEALGHRALQASDGAEAFNAFQMFRPEVVITDWEMPGISGSELAARIRAAEPIYTYIMLLTGRADESASREAVQLGADDVLAKPPDPAEIERGLIAAERITTLHRQMHAAARVDAMTGAGLALAPGRGPARALRAGRALRPRVLRGDGRPGSRQRRHHAPRGPRARARDPLRRRGLPLRAEDVRRAAARAGAGHREPRRRPGCGARSRTRSSRAPP